jgi:hypothetical protein
MSDQGLQEAILQMEAWLRTEPFPVDSESLKVWRDHFEEEVRSAERGMGWPELVQRSHAVAALLQERVQSLEATRDLLRSELDAQALGQRALRAYKPSDRLP